MTGYSELRQNPFDGTFSDRVMDETTPTIGPIPFLPGLYGFVLQDRPSPGTVTVQINPSGTVFSEVLTTPALNQFRVSYARGIVLCNVGNNGNVVRVNYHGRGTNITVDTLQALVNPVDFLQLTDTPSSYSGQAGKMVRVNGAANGLEFADPPVAAFLGLSDTPNSYANQKGKTVKVNVAENGLEFGNATDASNYVSFPVAIAAPIGNGWALYKDATQNSPVDGTGGTSAGTLTQNTTDPLSGSGDFRYTKVSGASRQGEGFSTDFTIENRHLSKVLQISFDYELISGALATDDFRVYIVYDTGGTPKIIEPIGVSIQGTIVGQRIKHLATFQTDASIKTYRLCIHVATTTNSNQTLDFNNFNVWEQERNYGAIITDPQPYTPSTVTGFGAGTFTSNLFFWRVGGRLRIKGSFIHTGTPNSSVLSLTFPNGHIAKNLTVDEPIGFAYRNTPAVGSVKNLSVALDTSNLNRFNISIAHRDVGFSPFSDAIGANNILNANERIYVDLDVAIEGWGSNMALSSNAGDGRLVSGAYSGHTGVSFTADVTTYKLNTRIKDSHNAYNTTTGELTIPVAGDYVFTKNFTIGSSGASSLVVWRNGISTGLRFCDINTSTGGGGSIKVPDLRAGDVITFRTGGSVTSGTNTGTNFEFYRLESGSQMLARDEDVFVEAFLSTNRSTDASTNLRWDTVTRDTHGAMNTTTGIFTAPISGFYIFAAFLNAASTGGVNYWQIFKNGSVYKSFGFPENEAASGGLYLFAGENFSIRNLTSKTLSGGLLSSSGVANITIFKV